MPVADNLTGVWHGVYSYGPIHGDEHFVAQLIDIGGSLSGTIDEAPRALGSGKRLNAIISGTRSGARVEFLKTYDGTGGWSHSVRYRGKLSADLTEIGGRWNLPGASGTFLMIRPAEEAKPAEQQVEATTDERS